MMSIGEPHIFIRETHSAGRETREWILHWGSEPLLSAHGLEAVGWVEAQDGYFHARPQPGLPLLFVCLDGHGEVWENGKWRRCDAGQAYLAPRGQPHAYRTVAGVSWKACWVLSREEALVGLLRPALVSASGLGLHYAIQGLYSEQVGEAEPAMAERWIEMILHSARRIGQSRQTAGRLAAVWERVAADLAYPWTMAALAQEASLSEESVRRLCARETGRSPMAHVTFLRMRSAASLLASRHYTIAEVTQRVGYSSPFAFSAAFKRVLGVPPSSHCR